MECGEKGDGQKSGKMPARADFELFSIEACDKAVMDFLAATEVGKFPPN
jgi:hypothetical protein